MIKVKYNAIIITCILGLSWLSACKNNNYTTLEGAVWNTTYTIKYRGDYALADSIQSIMREIESSLSPFNPHSRISAINQGTDSLVDIHINNVFTISQQVNKISHGAFDPTLSPLINLWGFGYTGHETIEPTDSAITQALNLVGISDCSIADDVIHKKAPGTTFNFSAVTKGYGCDIIASLLSDSEVTDYMIEIGGELALHGVNPQGDTWRVMIDAPVDSVAGHTKLLTLDLTDCCVATSGNYRNYRDSSTGRIGHTISAITGRPINTGTLSATIIAPSCAMADALATACMAMDYRQALDMINSIPDTHCILVITKNDSLSIATSQNFQF